MSSVVVVVVVVVVAVVIVEIISTLGAVGRGGDYLDTSSGSSSCRVSREISCSESVLWTTWSGREDLDWEQNREVVLGAGERSCAGSRREELG